MIDHLDNLLRTLLLKEVDELTDESQVRFQPPDDAWRTVVSNLTVNSQPANALNIYMVDLRENRKLRSNERVRTLDSGIVREEPAPARLDCHYILSAWSRGIVTHTIEPTLDEHALLYKAAAVLMQTPTLSPSQIYTVGSTALNAWPERFRDADLPITALPSEGFHKLSEFWTIMGQGSRWKPCLYLIVTIPVQMLREIAGPMVTTLITEYRQTGRPETAETLIQIGGQVLDTRAGTPLTVAGAWVALETIAGTLLQEAHTNGMGRYTFLGLTAGRYRLRARAPDAGEVVRELDVPTSTGEYDLRFV